jgi:uncharacterized protein (DUF2267 family)
MNPRVDPVERSESRRNQTFEAFLTYLRRVGSMSEELAEHSAVAVLCALERRILPEEARDLEAQLPAKLRDLLARCDKHAGMPKRALDREAFVGMVADELGRSPQEAEHLARAVFQAVRAQVSEGEAAQVEAQLPTDLRDLWRHRA